MQPAPRPANEPDRLAAVRSLRLLDTPPEERFDRITQAAVERLHVPMATISVLDEDREWFKSRQGWQSAEGNRDLSFCGHALLANDIFIVGDTTTDERFRDNPYVIGPPYVRFYAGMALYDKQSHLPVGVFCITDVRPRQLSTAELGIFLELADNASRELNAKPVIPPDTFPR